MYFIDDIYLIARLRRSQPDSFPQFTDIIDAPIAGRVNLNQIQRISLSDCSAGDAGIAWLRKAGPFCFAGFFVPFAVDNLSKNARRGCLPRSPRAGEEVRMRKSSGSQYCSQLLADGRKVKRRDCLRSVLKIISHIMNV